MHPDCPTCAGLLAAVIANRDDDLPRLMMADHLEGEHGDEASVARAEFIRVQCALSDISKCQCTPGGPMPCAFCSLIRPLQRQRQEELRPRVYTNAVYRSLFPNGGVDAFWDFVRGFVEYIRCTWVQWRDNDDALMTVTPIRRVTLMSSPMLHRGETLITHGLRDTVCWLVGCEERGRFFFSHSVHTRDATPRERENLMVTYLLGKYWPNITFTLPAPWIDSTGRLNPERLQRLREAGR